MDGPKAPQPRTAIGDESPGLMRTWATFKRDREKSGLAAIESRLGDHYRQRKSAIVGEKGIHRSSFLRILKQRSEEA